jgi:hypothetical protein
MSASARHPEDDGTLSDDYVRRQSLWNPATYLDPAYWAELQRRKAIKDSPVDLERQYRQEHSAAWPTPPANEC